jgi:hypothetical protein
LRQPDIDIVVHGDACCPKPGLRIRHHFTADPYPAFKFNADPDLTLQLNADPDPYQGDANLLH